MIFQASREFPTTCTRLFDSIFLDKPTNAKGSVQGDMLAAHDISGTPHEVGHVFEGRYNLGVLDYVARTTLLEYTRPFHLVYEELPICYLPYDPHERLPPIGAEAPRNPDSYFKAEFGEFPQAIKVTCQFETVNGLAACSLSITYDPERKPGWFRRKMWTRHMRYWSERIFAKMTDLG